VAHQENEPLLLLHIEALIFASDQALTIIDIQQVLGQAFEKEFSKEEILIHIEAIKRKYSNGHALELSAINGGFQFLTRKEHESVINQLQIQRSKKKLSQAALETLSIIAYRQPITKLEIEQIRGVNCDYTVQKLLEKELISISGKLDGPGKPLLYSTSSLFMDYFGINKKEELPQLSDIEVPVNEIGERTE